MKKGLLIVISGASGTGKGTVCKELLTREPAIAYSISATSRAPREGEQDGREYYFRTREEFEAMIADGAFLEYAATITARRWRRLRCAVRRARISCSRSIRRGR